MPRATTHNIVTHISLNFNYISEPCISPPVLRRKEIFRTPLIYSIGGHIFQGYVSPFVLRRKEIFRTPLNCWTMRCSRKSRNTLR
jgi:hypothetical protein